MGSQALRGMTDIGSGHSDRLATDGKTNWVKITDQLRGG